METVMMILAIACTIMLLLILILIFGTFGKLCQMSDTMDEMKMDQANIQALLYTIESYFKKALNVR